MSAILYGMIHSKAEKTYLGPKIEASNYELWVAHWFTCAGKLAEDFDKENLPITAQTIREIIVEQNKLLGKAK